MPRHLLKGKESVHSLKDSYVNVHSIFVIAPKLVTIQMLITGEWRNRMWCVCTMDYNSVESTTLLIHTTGWVKHAKLKGGGCETKNCLIPLIWNAQKRRIYSDRK